MSIPKPKLGGKADDLQTGSFEPGPGQGAMQYIPEMPKMLEGVFVANPADFASFRELYDPNGPDGLKSRPVEEDFVYTGSDDGGVTERALAPFYLHRFITNAAGNQGRDVGKLVALKMPKSLFGDLRAQFEMMGGQPLINSTFRLSKSGKGKNTKYSFVAVPDVGAQAAALSALNSAKTRDGRRVGVECTTYDWLIDVLEMDWENLHPANPENVKAAAARFKKPSGNADQSVQTVPGSMPTLDIPDESTMGRNAPPTADQLLALSLKDLRDMAIQYGVVAPNPDPAEFKANRIVIANQLAQALLQKAA